MEVTDKNVAEIIISFKAPGKSHFDNLVDDYCPIFKKSDEATGSQDAGSAFDKATLTLAHGNLPLSEVGTGDDFKRYQNNPAGDLHFNADINWAFADDAKNDPNTFNLYSIAVHEIGHTLGMPHNNYCEDSIMYYAYTNKTAEVTFDTKEALSAEDKLYIQCLYGEKPSWWDMQENRIFVFFLIGFVSCFIMYQLVDHYIELFPDDNTWMDEGNVRYQQTNLNLAIHGTETEIPAAARTQQQLRNLWLKGSNIDAKKLPFLKYRVRIGHKKHNHPTVLGWFGARIREIRNGDFSCGKSAKKAKSAGKRMGRTMSNWVA